jgi:hypothetical protein
VNGDTIFSGRVTGYWRRAAPDFISLVAD